MGSKSVYVKADRKAAPLNLINEVNRETGTSFTMDQEMRKGATDEKQTTWVWKAWQCICCERKIREEQVLKPSDRYKRNINKARDLKTRCCRKVTLDVQKKRTTKLRE